MLLWIRAHHCTDYRQAPWYSFYRDEIIINETFLEPSSKNIIVVDRWPKNQIRPTNDSLTFDESKSVCRKFCRNLYFPTTLEENNELRLFLDDIERTKHIQLYPWLRRIFFKWFKNEFYFTWFENHQSKWKSSWSQSITNVQRYCGLFE